MNVEQNFTAEYTHSLRSWVFYVRKAYSSLRAHKYGNNSAVISEVTGDDAGKVIIKTLFGGMRYEDMPASDLIPRVC